MVDYEEELDRYLDEIKELARSKQYARLRDLFLPMEPADIALLLEESGGELMPLLYRLLPKELAAEVFVELESDSQEMLINGFSNTELKEVLDELYLDDAVDIVEEMPANVVKKILRHVDEETRKMINQVLNYPKDSAGAMMTMEYVDLKRSMTVEQAFDRIRATGLDSETIYTCYVTDAGRRLEGVLTIKELLLAQDEQLIAELMETDVITAETTEDQEEAVARMMRYDFISLPVVDKEGRLVGIVTVDDVMDVMEEEATEDFEKMAAMLPSEKPYLKTSVFQLAKNRIPWLLILMLSSTITGAILVKYETAFAAVPLLVSFIPMLMDTGGNSGSQSSTMVIRGMALGEIEPSDVLKVLWKEIRVGFMVGFVLAVVNFIRLMIQYPGNTMICVTVVISMFATVVAAKTIGCTLPIGAKVLKLDPAIMASPMITTIVDAVSLMVYFNLACHLLDMAA